MGLFFGFSGKASAATNTVCASGCDKTTIAAALTAYTTSGDIIEVRADSPGGAKTFTTNLHSAAANVTLQGRTGDTIIIDGSGSADHTFHVTHAMTVNNVTIQGALANKINLLVDAAATFNDVIVQDGAYRGVQIAASAIFNRCTFQRSPSTLLFFSGNDIQPVFNNCKIQYAALDTIYVSSLYTSTPNGITFNNCDIKGAQTGSTTAYAINSVSNALLSKVTLNNCDVSANLQYYASSGYVFYYRGMAGNFILNNSNILDNPWNSSRVYAGTAPTCTNCIGEPLRFISHKYPSIVIVGLDDLSNLGDFKTLATMLEARGERGVLAANTLSATAGNWSNMANLANGGGGYTGGHEIASHSTDHVHLGDRRTFTLTYSNGAETATYAISGNILTLDSTLAGGADDHTVDLTTQANISALRMTIGGFSHWTATANILGGNSDNAIPTDLADIGATAIGIGVVPLLDETKFFSREITASKSSITGNVDGGYVSKTLVTPYNSSDPTSRAAMKAAGYTGASAGLPGTAISPDTTMGDYLLSNMNIYHIFRESAGLLLGKSGTGDVLTLIQVKQRLGAALELMGDKGGALYLYGHAFTASGELSQTEWGYVLDTLQANGTTVMTLSQAVDYIIANGSTADGGVTYTRTLTDTSNYNLLSSSPAIDAGTNVSLTSDFANNPIYGTPDIGGYEFQPPHTMGTDKIDVSAGARVYGDGKFRDLNTTSSNTADLKVSPTSGSFPTFNATDARPEWLNITNLTWTNSGNHHKAWTESSASLGNTNTLHTIGDLEANKNYNIQIDSTNAISNIIAANCSNISGTEVCKTDSNGKITFTYTGGYSTHTFDMTEGDNTPPTTTASLNTGTYNSAQNITLTCDDGAGVGCDKTYYTTDNSTPTTGSTQYSAPISISATTTLKFFSTDKNANAETYQTKTYTIDIDTTPPTLSNPQPSGTFPANTTQASLNVTTNENAICKFAISSGADWDAMTPFTTTGTTIHSQTIPNLSNGTNYQYFVKCQDEATNLSSESNVAFSVATPAVVVNTDNNSHKDSKPKPKPKPKPRTLHQSNNSIKSGQIVVRTGKKFSKNSKIALYFSKRDGTYYNPIILITTKQGTFSLARRIQKTVPGRYSWYAQDLKTGRKSKVVRYSVR